MIIKWIWSLKLFISYCVFAQCSVFAQDLYLRDNLYKANPGDYIVIAFNNTNTVMHIRQQRDNLLTVEEISTPEIKRSADFSWKEWVRLNAPGHTNWVMYEIDLKTAKMIRYYSFSKQNWYEIPDNDNFLSKLLNLKLIKIPENMRKKIGPKVDNEFDMRAIWQPQMIVEGSRIPGTLFDAWRTKWPRDASELSGKTIEIYTPQSGNAYFPHWLQIHGVLGKAKIRVIDSGSGLSSPKPPLPNEHKQEL